MFVRSCLAFAQDQLMTSFFYSKYKAKFYNLLLNPVQLCSYHYPQPSQLQPCLGITYHILSHSLHWLVSLPKDILLSYSSLLLDLCRKLISVEKHSLTPYSYKIVTPSLCPFSLPLFYYSV